LSPKDSAYWEAGTNVSILRRRTRDSVAREPPQRSLFTHFIGILFAPQHSSVKIFLSLVTIWLLPMGTTFNAFWYGPPLNAFHWTCMRSFVSRGHDFRLYVYEPIDVPEGVTLMDASEILSQDSLFFFGNPATGKPDVGPFSDLFRFKLLLMLGGWYVDIDTICIATDFPSVERAWAQENPKIHPNTINGAQMALRKGDPLARELYERCLARSKNYVVREDLGPNLLSEVIPEFGLPPNIFGTPTSFYPIDWISIFKSALPAFRTEIHEKVSAAYFLAAYQSFFQYCGIDLARTPPSGSYLRELYEKWAPDRMGPDAYSAEQIISLVRIYLERNRDWAIPELIRAAGPEILDHLGMSAISAYRP